MTLPTPSQAPSSMNIADYNQQVAQGVQQTNALSAAVDGLMNRLDGLGKRTGKKLFNFATADFAVLSGATATTATFEHQLHTLNATAAITPLNMKQVKSGIESAFTSLPVSRTDVVSLATALTGLGVQGARDIGKLTSTFLKLSAATGESPEALAGGLVQLSRLMGNTEAGKIEHYANSLLTVSKNAGVSATGVLSFAQSIAPLARQAGISQQSVLGISAAFSKAGADGFVAANTFNSIISDITQLTQSGSPQLSKYANLIGVTSKQFRSMDKTTAFQQIFETIAKQGPQAINTLNRLGIDGVRAQSAIAAVVQSGDLGKNIATAQAAAGDSKNLNKASAAGSHGILSNLEMIRNQGTDILSSFGEGLQKPIDALTSGLNKFMQMVNTVTKPLAPFLELLGGIAGALSAIGGGALLAGGLMAKLVLAGFVARSSPVAAFTQGRRTARTGQETDASRRAAAGQLRGWQQGPYAAGVRAGQRARVADNYYRATGERPPSMVSRVAAMPVRAANWFVRGQTDYVRTAGTPGFERSPGLTGWAAGRMSAARNWFRGGETEEPRRPMPGPGRPMPGAGGMPASRPMPGPGVPSRGLGLAAGPGRPGEMSAADGYRYGRPAPGMGGDAERAASAARVAASRAVASADESVVKGHVGLGAASKALMGSFARLEGATIKSSAVIAGQGLKRAGGAIAGGLGGAVGIGLLAAFMLPSLIGPKLKEASKYNNDTTSSMNPLQKLNDQLGIATTNLADFSSGVKNATPDKSSIPANISLRQASTVGPDDLAASSSNKNTDKTLSAVADRSSKDPQAAIAYGRSLHMTDNRSVAAFKQNLLGAGYKDDDVNRILAGITKGGTGFDYNADYGLLSGIAAKGEGNSGLNLANNLSGAGSRLNQGIFSGIGQQYNTDLTSHSVGYAKTKEYQRSLGVLSKLGGSVDKSKANTKQFENALAILTGTSADKVSEDLVDYDTNGVLNRQATGNLSDPKNIAKLLSKFGGGRQYLGSVSGAGGETDLNYLPKFLAQTRFDKPTQNAYEKNVREAGPLGRYSQDNKTVQAAYGAPQDPALQYRAMLKLFTSAGGENGRTDKVVGQFDALTGKIKDTSDQLYILTRAAKQYAREIESFKMPYQSRTAQFGQSARDYMQAYKANRDNPTADTAGDLKEARAGYEQQKLAYDQYLIQVFQSTQAYGIQMRRAEEDNYRSRFRAQRDFQISMTQQQQDFDRQRARAERDHAIQLKNQAASQSQTIYNPYQRQNAVFTIDSGTLSQNLGDQNQRLRTQKKELDALKTMGLSLEAIQTLNLADVNNAQQLDALLEDAKRDPSVIPRLNAQTATRRRLTRAVTQNSYNLSFQQSNEDFTRGLKDAQRDYNIARARAVQAQARSLADMASDYEKMVTRSGEDLQTSMTELFGSFEHNYTRTMREISRSIGKKNPELADALRSQIDGVMKVIDGPLSKLEKRVAKLTTIVPGLIGVTPSSAPAATPGSGAPDFNDLYGGHAEGGISTREHVARFSEGNKAEMMVPLDNRGIQYMTTFTSQVTQAMMRRMHGSVNPLQQIGGGSGTHVAEMKIDKSTNFTGPVTVEASDPNEMARKLEEKERMRRLTSPRGARAG